MKLKNRTIATIDLGSNSILMLVVQRNEDGEIHVLYDGSEVVKLGEGVKETHNISTIALDRAVKAIQHYQKDLEKFQIEKIFLTATSAMREAENRDAIIESIRTQTSIEVELLPKVEEVRLTYKSVLAEEGHDDPSLVIDIGGGSTEIGWGIGSRYDGGRSLNLGTVKLLEGPLRPEKLSESDLQLARAEIDREMIRVTPLGDLDHYYGTAGSFTQAAALELQLQKYTSQAVDHFKLKKEHVARWLNELAPLSIEQKKLIPGIDPKRIDVIVPGLLIIERLFQKFQNDEFIVRDRGIRFGKAFDQFRDFKPQIFFDY